MESVVIKTKDCKLYTVSNDNYNQMYLLKNLLQDIDGGTSEEIPINVTGDLFEVITKYLEQHKLDEPLSNEYIDDIYQTDVTKITDWDREYIKDFPRKTLEDLIEASEFLNIRRFTDLCCYQYAEIIKNFSEDEFNEFKKELPPDFLEVNDNQIM